MAMGIDQVKTICVGHLELFEKTTGDSVSSSNLVVRDAPHIFAVAMGDDIIRKTIKIASWGDSFVEVPSKTGIKQTQLEALSGVHIDDNNHTVSEIRISGHSYPAYKSIRFSFEFDPSSAPDLVGKNLREWGLCFNDVLFSRVALDYNYIFENWMTISGYWTIIFTTCSGGFSNTLLNQYEISSLWGFDHILDNKVEDYVGTNNLTSILSTPRLAKNMVGGAEGVTEDDIININSLPVYRDGLEDISTIPDDDYDDNVFYITHPNQNDRLHLNSGKFTIWQWFRVSDFSIQQWVDLGQPPFQVGSEFVLLSKWMTSVDGEESRKGFRLFLTPTSIDSCRIIFDINDGGNIVSLSSYDLPFGLESPTHFNIWNLCVITFDNKTNELKMFLNDEEISNTTLLNNGVVPLNQTTFFIGSQQLEHSDPIGYDKSRSFRGIIGEVGVSNDVLSRGAISLLYNNGIGDFYTP